MLRLRLDPDVHEFILNQARERKLSARQVVEDLARERMGVQKEETPKPE